MYRITYALSHRVIALVLACVILASLIPASVVAAEDPVAVITVGESYAMPGATVSVTVTLDQNPGIGSALLTLFYPAQKLTLVGVEQGDALSALEFTHPESFYPPCSLLWDTLDTEATGTGKLFTATFVVSENAVAGETYNISVNCVSGDMTDKNNEPVAVKSTAGKIKIIDFTPGDVNGDKRINGTDVSMLRRHIAGGYGVKINTDAADVNADGRLNGTDVSWIRRHIAGGYGITLKPAKTECPHLNLSAVAAKAVTCTENGNIAYWYCPTCDGCFSDAAATTGISQSSTVITAAGHKEVVDQAVAPTYDKTGLTEGSHCSVCKTVIIQQEVVDKLEKKTHAIIYRNLQGVESPEPSFYAETDDMIILPKPERPGYTFKGWYTSSNFKTVVNYIPAGSTKDFILFAKWEIETYQIDYLEAPENENPTEYTAEDRVILDDPKWSGLVFTGWTDQDGNTITEIPKGSSGDLVLTANWKRLQNIATPGNTRGLLKTYDPVANRYYFIYEIGTIEHVPLEKIASGKSYLQYNSGATDVSFSMTDTVTITDEVAKEISNTVSESVSKSQGWEESTEWGNETSNEHKVEVSVSAEFGFGPVQTEIEAGYGYTNTSSESWGKSETEGGSTDTETGTEHESASTVSYMKEISSSVTTSYTIESESPLGYYAYVRAGNVRVFGIVTYDPVEDTLYLDTYSLLDNMHEVMLYFRNDAELNENACETLSYDIPRDRILKEIEETCFVVYDGNGADAGSMNTSAFSLDVPAKLEANQYSRIGYKFGGWAYNGTVYEDCATVVNLASNAEIITLKAVWIPIEYAITYNANEPAYTFLPAEKIPEHTIAAYDQQITLAEAPELMGYIFTGWYLDVECTQRVGGAGETVGALNLTTEQGGTGKLYAGWTGETYELQFIGPTGAVMPEDRPQVYGQPYGELPKASMEGYYFAGWIDPNTGFVNETTLLPEPSDHGLWAQFIPYTITVTIEGSNRKTIEDDSDSGVPYWTEAHKLTLNFPEVYASDFSKVDVKVSFYAKEEDKGYQECYLYFGNSGTGLAAQGNYQKFEAAGTKLGSETLYLTCNDRSVSTLAAKGWNFTLGWGANGDGGDTWKLGKTEVTFTFKP